MIIFNTAQRRMSLDHQLEIMESGIMDELKEKYRVDFVDNTHPGSHKHKFKGSEFVMALRAFVQQDHMLTKSGTADDIFSSSNDDSSLPPEQVDIACGVIAYLARDLDSAIADFYEACEDKIIHVLRDSTSQFVVPMMASLGRVSIQYGFDPLQGLRRIVNAMQEQNDVLRLEEYFAITEKVVTSKSSTIKNLVERAFREYFASQRNNACVDWDHAWKARGTIG